MIRRTKPRGNEESKETKKAPVLKFSDTQLIASGAASHRNVFSALADTSVEMIDVDIGGDHSGEDVEMEEPNNSQNEKSSHENPVFRELAVINGKINRMSNDELKRKCV
ncbi:uncharacterized protein LOC119591275 [Penaeus monodon]|uniref:uncharacterized protein LOC119591275 n=1 Tax=Penaeus monodon TaxID=6687 RepID=UPI0018A6F20F|nr:uncharacterized protein LOC119591275 [Penaeus monodon]XP_037796983.1 uncharacterized protein LOC119591275 [Penaeus monodon]